METTLLTVFGTILGFVISFRTSSAIERYNEGKKLLSSIAHATRTFARLVRFNVPDKPTTKAEDDKAKDEHRERTPLMYLEKLGENHRNTAIQLVKEFSHAVMIFLRKKQQDEDEHKSLKACVSRVTNALVLCRGQGENQTMTPVEPGLKPLEITFCLSSYVAALQQFQLDGPTTGGLLGAIDHLVESFTDLEKVSTDKIPFSYRCQLWAWIALYLLFLPFQLWKTLRYLTIPGTSIAAFIFLGLHSAGEEIENPFDDDPNDLKLKEFCESLTKEIQALETPSEDDSDSKPWKHSGRVKRVFETSAEDEKGDEEIGEELKEWAKSGQDRVLNALGWQKGVREASGETVVGVNQRVEVV
ncbi:unnamed protein product [Rhizoctonia solani]|uniref:Uncharacterized protein n=1 Tax=Rhizoctonia solani TaxID=456999 RepID=A0A8H3DAF0_9AGAM|nr:unnamed protein product [Rhizoctonia solani]